MQRYLIPLVLWGAVLVVAGFYLYRSGQQSVSRPDDQPESIALISSELKTETVSWNYLSDVDRFVLTDQSGQDFDSQQLAGRKPMVISFFYATCPGICRNLNKEIHRLNQALKGTDIQFVTITVDPKNDTPEVLSEYAAGYDAKPDRWAFLTGTQENLVNVGEHVFNVPIDPGTHTDNIMLVDKWGKFRDRFKWDDPQDTKRFLRVAREVAAETEPPLGQTVETRNVLAGKPPINLAAINWLRDFHLTDSTGQPFFSRELTGQVWLAQFPRDGGWGVSLNLWNEVNSSLDQPVTMVLINPQREPADTQQLSDDSKKEHLRWCCGDPELVKRIGVEYFGWGQYTDWKAGLHVDGTELPLFVVDRWGEVRDRFRLGDEQELDRLKETIVKLQQETQPAAPEFGFDHPQESDE